MKNILAKEIGEQMLERLAWMTLKPKVIVVAGDDASTLQESYPEAKIIETRIDDTNLSFSNHSVDLIFANLILPGCADLEKLLQEWRRILRPEGLLIFSSLGPDTLQDWRSDLTLPHFMDMHDIGDALVSAKFADPVLDVDYFTIKYAELKNLVEELKIANIFSECDEKLMHRAPMTTDGKWSTTYEIVFGHAWGPQKIATQTADELGVVNIPLSHLRRRS